MVADSIARTPLAETAMTALSPHLFSSFDQNGVVRHGLPSGAYTSPDFFTLEASQVFAKSWTFVGFAHDLANVGDVRPIRVAGTPLLLVRSADRKIRAFHNVCRHRNLKLVKEPRNCKSTITCPYHRWSYDLEGRLKAAPYFGGEKTALPEGCKLEDHGLHEVRCGQLHDWLFVNISGDAPSFESHTEPLRKQLESFNLDDFTAVASLEFGEVQTNWKLLMENFIEPYHVQFVHKTTTSQPLSDHYLVLEDHCLGSAVDLTPEQQLRAKADTLSVSSRYLTLFPNFVLGLYYPDQIGVHLNQPVSAETTRQRRMIYVHKDSDQSAEAVEQLSTLWDSVHREDHEMCERLQEGRHSTVAEQGGVLSPHWEASVRKFQELVADSMRPALANQP